jgi:glyoxylase-like metal-dependent hydrolase (beta-lactamase superfamily II)
VLNYESEIDRRLKSTAFNLETDIDIDYLLMTHLHFDHASGLTDNEGNASF